GTAGSDTVAIDRLNPSVTVDIVASSLSDGTPSSNVTFTFTEPEWTFLNTNHKTTTCTLCTLMQNDPTHYHTTFTATDGFAGTGTLALHTFPTRRSSDLGTAGSDTVAIDRLNPSVTVDIVASSLSDGTPSSNVTFTF